MSIKYKGQTVSGGSGSSFTPDETLTMSTENVLGVATPVKRILTQAEFDALPEDEQKKGLYVIPGGGNDGLDGSPAGEIYSTEETCIGTWIDGKPLYRKVYEITTPSETDREMVVANIPHTYIVKKYEGYFYSTQPLLKLGLFFSTSLFTSLYWIPKEADSPNKGMMVGISNSAYANRPGFIILEYTKTTD